MTPNLDSTLEMSVPYCGFEELRAQAFALSEAVRIRYDLSVEELVVFAINNGYTLSGKVERTEEVRSLQDPEFISTFGYNVTLIAEGGLGT